MLRCELQTQCVGGVALLLAQQLSMGSFNWAAWTDSQQHLIRLGRLQIYKQISMDGLTTRSCSILIAAAAAAAAAVAAAAAGSSPAS
jgi:hypothetical protein